MRVFSWQELKNGKINISHTAITIGTFDGCHLGHQKLFKAVQNWKNQHKKNNPDIKSGVIFFSHPPRVKLIQDESCQEINNKTEDIMSLNQKLDFFELTGFDFAVVIDFSSQFSKIKGTEFLEILRNNCSMQFLACGSDFRLGYKADTGVAEISSFCSKNGLDFAECTPVLVNSERISSSFIRKAILKADFNSLSLYLGHDWEIDATEFEWCFNRSEKYLALTAARSSYLLLPPSKEYECILTLNDKNQSVLQGNFCVESDFLRLEIPPEQCKSGNSELNQFIHRIKIIRSK
jgi:FAD synthase